MQVGRVPTTPLPIAESRGTGSTQYCHQFLLDFVRAPVLLPELNLSNISFRYRYWSRRFKDQRGSKYKGRLVPKIFVDDASSQKANVGSEIPTIMLDDGGVARGGVLASATPTTPTRRALPPLDVSGPLGFSDYDMFGSSTAPQFNDVDPFAPSSSSEESPSVLRQRTGRGRSSDGSLSPTLSPSMSPSMSPNMSPTGSPRLDPVATTSGWIGRAGHVTTAAGSPSRMREESEVTPQNVLEVLGSSEWGEQIRSYIESRQPPSNQGGDTTSR